MSWQRFFRRKQWDRERASELDSYLAHETEENIARGMAPQQAREAAQRKLGNTTLIREEIYHMNSLPILETLWQDTRYAFRLFAKAPAITALIILTLALGIGGNSAIFSLVNAVLLKPLPFPEPDRLVMVLERSATNPQNTFIVSAPNYLNWEKQADVFERMVIYEYLNFNLSGDNSQPDSFSGLRVSAGVPEVTGVQPMLGRWFTKEEEPLGKNNVVVLSYHLWQNRYQGAQDIVGRVIRVNQQPHTVIGAMPRGFIFPASRQALWVPIGFNAEDQGRASHSFWVSARLKRGVTIEQADAQMNTIGLRLAKEYPDDNAGESAAVTPMRNLFMGEMRSTLLFLLLAVAFVLLIACVNIANLLMSRCNARQKELAVRTALGAGRARLAVQLLTESVILALLGTALGIALATALIPLMVSSFPGLRNLPFRNMQAVSMDWRVFGFTVAVALLTGLLAGLLPAWQTLRAAPGDFLKEGSRGSTSGGGKKLRSTLIAIEVALALVVLACAGLMVTSISRLVQVDPGLNPNGVFLMGISLPQPDFYGPPQRQRFCQDVAEQVGGIAGVNAVSAASHVPLSGANAGRGFIIEGHPDPGRENGPGASYGVICPDYFRTMEIKMLAGRDFNHLDSVSAPPVAIVNQELARRYFGKENPVGKRIKLGRFTSPNNWMTIVGVVGDVRHWGLDSRLRPYLYRPYSQAAWPGMSVLVRTPSNAATLSEVVRQRLTQLEPEQPVSKMVTLEGIVENSMGARTFPMRLLASFGAVALVLAAIGIYGMVSYSVAQRTQEIGIRMALGARPSDAYRLVTAEAMLPVMLGVLAGVGGAFAATRFIRALLYEVTTTDPATFAAVTTLLIAVAAAACLLPARRAARVDPLTALRYE